MNKINILKYALLLVVLFLLSAASFAQNVPEGVYYQAVARDTSGKELKNTTVLIRFTVRSGSATGTVEYQETHNTTTNKHGLISVTVGNGAQVGGNAFSAISWGSNNHFLEVEIDITGTGSSYQSMGAPRFWSVPYALYAKTSGSGTGGATGPTGAPGTQGTSITGPTGPTGAGIQGPTGAP
ncbi:hypothetical protein JYU20_04200, partial [Bacteroidales bacterium AH-315-I05]|nr:hypothetical protein [Bacteroidales bacterium AH-315-I05]